MTRVSTPRLRSRHARLIPAALAACAAFALLAFASPNPSPDEPTSPDADSDNRDQSPFADFPITDIENRLQQLDPADPEGYFLLAEEVLAESYHPEAEDLAIRLFVLTFELDRSQPGGGTLAASACLALADTPSLNPQRHWLHALAVALDDRHTDTDPDFPVQQWATPKNAVLAAEALGHFRTGQGVRARELLYSEAVSRILERFDALLAETGQPGITRALRREADHWPCPECANRRIIRRPGTPTGHAICAVCRGTPGPRLSRRQLLRHLRFESRLLSGIHESWSAQLATDHGAPLRDPDPDELPPTLGIDTARTVWRDGRWTEPEPAASLEIDIPDDL